MSDIKIECAIRARVTIDGCKGVFEQQIPHEMLVDSVAIALAMRRFGEQLQQRIADHTRRVDPDWCPHHDDCAHGNTRTPR